MSTPEDPGDAEKKKLLRRRVYVVTRLEVIREEIRTLRAEQKNLTEAIRLGSGDDVRPLVRRRIYVSTHTEVLLEEQKRLIAERTSLTGNPAPEAGGVDAATE